MWICSHKQRYIKNSRRTVPTYKQQPKMPQDINLVMSPHIESVTLLTKAVD
ncbi:hypothetical protein AB3I54_06090 [Enterococcus sp. C47]|uniref:hypothetical protein n=1 Tax=Enterococcus TaxID=1350 RepID=UPI00287FE426|nr:hypothetical protein [Enterococcus faecalis]